MKELQIASNMIALARNRSGKNKRSAMLRMIMPLLSQSNGEKLADAIANKSSKKFAQIWDHIKHEIKGKLDHQHTATASSEGSYADVTTFQRDGATDVSIQTYGPRKIRISLNGETINELQPVTEVAPAVAQGEPVPVQNFPADSDCQTTGITSDQICKLVKLVCERMLMGADPCPLPPSNCCATHDWPNCVVCNNKQGTEAFDFNANILELYDTLTASASSY
ncbi:hypothetical protein LU11_gp132 [Pseudomonas phage Lu11]|uniref:hypothetical protein n=1 Tax=Pseudomonas phage Lu11 TaxID=1161927 RepID=UPI00025F17A9|nr:hypothetical protein LU11_gp132 [Pseudomonas phage Lu11]AFH14663.1 hypothetical protein Lu11_0129 [Pseudomonas phage Lu11]